MFRAEFDLVKYGRAWPIYYDIAKYCENDNLAIQLFSDSEGYTEPWSTLTTNLSEKLFPDCAYVDINNNGEEIIKWISDNKFGVPTGRNCQSGRCVYPLYRFDMKRFNQS